MNNKKKLKNLLIKESPNKFRLQFWLAMSGASREKALHKGYYYKLNYQYPPYIPSKCESVINADLKRTCPNEEYFKLPENKKKLKNILMAYTRRNSKIGYCQGFNFIVAKLLLLFKNEQDVFWLFVQIIENILPCDYYSELVGIMGDCSLCLKILKESNKKIMKKFEGFEIILNNLLYKWFISLFVENTSNDTFIQIWDAVMIDGNIVLLRAVSSILELMEDEILRCEGIEDLTVLLEEKISIRNFPREKFMKLLLNEGKLKYTEEQIENMKVDVNKEVIKTIINTKKKEVKKKELDINGIEIECDLDYPFCLKEIEEEENKNPKKSNSNQINESTSEEEKERLKKELEEKEIKDFQLKHIQLVQTFRTNNQISIVSNYFQKNSELKEGPFIDEEEEDNVKKEKIEAIFGYDPSQQQPQEEKVEKDIHINETLKENVKVYNNLLIHRDEHLCKTKKQTSDAILNQGSKSNEELSKTITYKRNANQNYLSNKTKDKNSNSSDEFNTIIGSIHKSYNQNSELELMADDEKIVYNQNGSGKVK